MHQRRHGACGLSADSVGDVFDCRFRMAAGFYQNACYSVVHPVWRSGGRRGGGNVVATAQSDKTDTACATGRGGIYSSDDRVRALTTYKRVLVAAICRG